jgi:hypothetical protein
MIFLRSGITRRVGGGERQREKERENIIAFCDVMSSWGAQFLMFQRTVMPSSSEASIPVFALQQSITSQMT